jgi:hypothetical protein
MVRDQPAQLRDVVALVTFLVTLRESRYLLGTIEGDLTLSQSHRDFGRITQP